MRAIDGFIGTTILAIASIAIGDSAQALQRLPTGFVEDELVTGLATPTGMSFAPDGRLFLCEMRTGAMRMVVNGHLAATDPVGVVDSLTNDGEERGLQGIVVDPRWPAFPYVYVIHTHVGPREVLVRYTASGDVANPLGENITLGAKRTIIHNIRDQFQNHNGGCLRFGPDGMLYVTFGDDGDQCGSQDTTSLLGKLLRLDVSRIPPGGGGPVPRALLIPPDNPLSGPDSNARLVYAYGLRNPWRFQIDPLTGMIVLGDVGENVEEEIDVILPGRNYGWPYREGSTIHTPPPACPEPGGPGMSTFEPPILTLPNGALSTAVLVAAIYRPVAGAANNWPSHYHGNVIFGNYYESRLRRLVSNGATWNTPPPVPGQPDSVDWSLGLHWNSDYAVGPDGSLWRLKPWDDSFNPSSGSVRRIRYVPTLDAAAPAGAQRLVAVPNPFREIVSLALDTTADGAILEILDLSGRVLRRIEATEAATARLTWDGRGHGGQTLPSGLYFVRVAGGRAGALRIVKL